VPAELLLGEQQLFRAPAEPDHSRSFTDQTPCGSQANPGGRPAHQRNLSGKSAFHDPGATSGSLQRNEVSRVTHPRIAFGSYRPANAASLSSRTIYGARQGAFASSNTLALPRTSGSARQLRECR